MLPDKVEILKINNPSAFIDTYQFDGNVDGIECAMDEYAKQVAIDFAEWMQRYSLYDYSKHPYKYTARQHTNGGMGKPEQFTAKELFEKYIKAKP